MNISEILILKYPDADFTKDIRLSLVGNAIVIREWNLPGSKPSQATLDQWAIELDLDYRQKLAREARVYPPITDQLDMQYHDLQDNTTTWEDAIAAVKAAHPIPQE